MRTGLVVWEWHAFGHIPLADSYATPSNSADYDAFHLNSIEPVAGDRVLVSARDTSAVYLVDRSSGQIVWTLGGKASSFRLRPGARFYFQHDAQLLGRNEVSLFDDEAGPPMEAPSSRGLILALDMRDRTASVAHQYRRPGSDTLAQSEGSFQQLPGGNVFVGSARPPSSRVLADRHAAVRREPAEGRRQLSRGSRSMERHADDAPSGGCATPVAVKGRGLRELERRHDGRTLAGPRRSERCCAAGRGIGARPRLRDADRAGELGDHVRRARAELEWTHPRDLRCQ